MMAAFDGKLPLQVLGATVWLTKVVRLFEFLLYALNTGF